MMMCEFLSLQYYIIKIHKERRVTNKIHYTYTIIVKYCIYTVHIQFRTLQEHMRDHLDWFGDVVSKISYNDWLSSGGSSGLLLSY